MHPIERLRMVARAGREEPTLLAREAASALAAFAGEPAALVTACRRLIDRQPACGPVWWVAARVLAAADPDREAWRAGNALAKDPTPAEVAATLPDGVTVLALGWPEQVAEALLRRGDVSVLVVDALGDGGALADWLQRAGSDAQYVPESGTAAAVAEADLVLLEAVALGPTGLVAVSGSAAAASVAKHMGVPVWAVAGEGRVLPGPLWHALAERLAARVPAWTSDEELVPATWIDLVVGPGGSTSMAGAAERPTCPPVPELAR